MKKIASFISVLFVGYATFSQTIVINDDYARNGPILRLNNNGYQNVVYVHDSLMEIDSICGRIACVCDIDKKGKIKNLDVLWFFQRYPSNCTYMKKEMDSRLYKTIVDNLEFQIRKNGVFVCSSNVKIMSSRQGFAIPIVIRRNRGTIPTLTKGPNENNN